MLVFAIFILLLGAALVLLADRKTLAAANALPELNPRCPDLETTPAAPPAPAAPAPSRVSQVGLPQVALGVVRVAGHEYSILAPLWTVDRCLLAVRDHAGHLPTELLDVSEQIRAAAARIAARQPGAAGSAAAPAQETGAACRAPTKEPHP